MKSIVADLIQGVATVALIIVATRWVSASKGAGTPITRNGEQVYPIKRSWSAVSYIAAVFFTVIGIVFLRGSLRNGEWPLSLMFIAAGGFAFWFGTGVVRTNDKGVTKRALFRSRSLAWDEITEVRLHRKDGGAVELRSQSHYLIVDTRFVAHSYLVDEVVNRTRLQPIRD